MNDFWQMNIYIIITLYRYRIGCFIIIQIISAAPFTKSDNMAKSLEGFGSTIGWGFDSSMI